MKKYLTKKNLKAFGFVVAGALVAIAIRKEVAGFLSKVPVVGKHADRLN